MSDKPKINYNEDQDTEPVSLGYEGSDVTMLMRFLYLAFLVFSIYYVISNGVPSLRQWLTNPPIQLFG